MALTSTGQLEEILRATSTGWWEYDAVSGKIDVSPGWLGCLGYTEEQQSFSIKQWLLRVHSDDLPIVIKQLSSTQPVNDCLNCDWRMMNSNGSFVWLSSRIKVLEQSNEGTPLKIQGLIYLNTQGSRMDELEKDARKKAQMLEGIMQISFSSTSVYDFVNQKVITSQWRIMQRLGYGPEEYEGVSAHFFEKILHPDDTWIIEKHIEKIRHSKKDEIFECVFRIRNKKGVYHWIALRDSVLNRTKDGNVCKLVGSIVDVTRYKALKLQLDTNLARLESLSYRNSHELRAPVATILGLVQVIRHELETKGSIQELIDALEQTISKMDKVIHEFGKALSE